MVKKQLCGSWKSPIDSSMMVDAAIRWGNLHLDHGTLYWNEMRQCDKGRSVIVKWDKEEGIDMTPPPYNVRTRVHEYGGVSFTVFQETLYFSNFEDQNFYSLGSDGKVRQVVAQENKRYAQPIFDRHDRLIYAIEETHRSKQTVLNALVVIDPSQKNSVKTLNTGHDFYSSIAISPDGTQIAFLTWDHPLMPWDGTELWTAQILPDHTLKGLEKVAGSHNESIFQPRFAPDGTLFFVSDRTGFWNLYQFDASKQTLPCYPIEAEFGSPQWSLGMSRYDFLQKESGKYQIACNYTIKGVDRLALLDLQKYTLRELPFPFTHYSEVHASKERLYFIASSPSEVSCLYSYNLDKQELKRIRRSKEIQIEKGYLSMPEMIEFETGNQQTSFGFYYPPTNKKFTCLEGEAPPLIVKSHGGPSSQVTMTLDLEIQFWTSRGFAFLAVNYGGSTGYGRAYRERLRGRWGVVDVEDCVNGALHLARKGKADPERLAIRGRSAGGYTTLAALAFRNTFKAGASYFGVSDLIELARETHKFESHYLESLVGAYPEEKKRYLEYSPIYQEKKLSCPVIFFQGDEDKIVPKEQSEQMFQTLKSKGIPTAYLLFKGEQHGFRKAENIKKAIDSELYFYSQIFHFNPSDQLDPVEIENWEKK